MEVFLDAFLICVICAYREKTSFNGLCFLTRGLMPQKAAPGLTISNEYFFPSHNPEELHILD